MSDEKIPREGWMAEKPQHTRRYHYILDTRALCGRYGFYQADLMPSPPNATRGPEDCAECFKRLQRREAE